MLFKPYQFERIDKRTKYAVHGWIRNEEKVLKLNNMPLVITTILILYFRDDEIFDTISDKGIQLSENKKIITRITHHHMTNTNYGATEIPSGNGAICKWDLRVIKDSSKCIDIGIVSQSILTPNKSVTKYNSDCYYSWRSGGYQESHDTFTLNNRLNHGIDDKISIILDKQGRRASRGKF